MTQMFKYRRAMIVTWTRAGAKKVGRSAHEIIFLKQSQQAFADGWNSEGKAGGGIKGDSQVSGG